MCRMRYQASERPIRPRNICIILRQVTMLQRKIVSRLLCWNSRKAGQTCRTYWLQKARYQRPLWCLHLLNNKPLWKGSCERVRPKLCSSPSGPSCCQARPPPSRSIWLQQPRPITKVPTSQLRNRSPPPNLASWITQSDFSQTLRPSAATRSDKSLSWTQSDPQTTRLSPPTLWKSSSTTSLTRIKVVIAYWALAPWPLNPNNRQEVPSITLLPRWLRSRSTNKCSSYSRHRKSKSHRSNPRSRTQQVYASSL